MNKFNRKTFLLLLSGILLLGIISAAAWFLYSEIDETSRVIREASANYAQLQEKEREFEESAKNLQKFSVELANLDRAFLREDTFVDLLRQVEDLARSSGVKFKAISAKVPTAATDKANLSFEIEGEKESLVRFFILLDHIPYAGIVESLSWGQLGKGSELIKVNVSYIIFNYIKK